ncbi:DUF7344 domain-containing protein [Natronobeatus ordinarius]|uniref:DUF7344 domain-containing protein n=1 Tax=Natronobeatus ordinarius TaxID=2963433 RepID=UPI0020CBDFA6|nr:hypothetical protein [Natronobeatus ordinarius]
MADGRNHGGSSTAVDAIDDDLFVALRNRHRRYALYFLLEHESVSTTELADVIAGWTHLEAGIATREDRDELHAALVHQHLPLLEDVGLIDRDGEFVTRANWTDPVPSFVRRGLEWETSTHGS